MRLRCLTDGFRGAGGGPVVDGPKLPGCGDTRPAKKGNAALTRGGGTDPMDVHGCFVEVGHPTLQLISHV